MFRLSASCTAWLTLACSVPFAAAAEWLPIDPEELRMTAEPKAPNAPAIYLYRQVDRNDDSSQVVFYSRIKILNEEGRKYADIEIPYRQDREAVRAIEARTIRPDGSVVEFDGTIYQKPLIKGRGIKYMAKTFTLPDVQVGSIIEYRYRHDLPSHLVFDSNWILSSELFTKHAKYSLVPSPYFRARFSWPVGLPPGTNPPEFEKGKVRLETRDVAAFVEEDYMPPEGVLKYRVDFIYIGDDNKTDDPVKYWQKFGKQRFSAVERFVDEDKAMQQAVAQIVAPTDSTEAKLRKIYARTQQFRNTSFERAKTEEEIAREKEKEAKDVADVWKLGYGNGEQITWLFLALARAAGFEADPVLISTRDDYFFNNRVMNPYHINTNVVVVKLDGKDTFFDPGTAFTPFGMLPWNETGVKGLRLNKDGGAWVETPVPAPQDSQTLRNAKLKLTTNLSLEGTVTVTYTGLEALWRRSSNRNDDETERKDFLEDELERDIPSGIEVKLVNKPDWSSSDVPLVAEFELKVPGWASTAGQRALLPIGLFGQGEQNTFKHAARAHPIYFSFPYKATDDVSIELPPDWHAGSTPPPHNTDLKVIGYLSQVENKGQSLQLKRELYSNIVILDRKYYSQLRDFFQTVRTQDGQQVVITRAARR